MPQVQTRTSLHNLIALHPIRIILYDLDRFWVDRFEKTWPARSRIKLGVGTKQGLAGGGAQIGAFFVVIPIRVVKGLLGALFDHDIISIPRQYFLPVAIWLCIRKGFGVFRAACSYAIF